MAAGYRAFRMGAADSPANGPFNVRERVHKLRDDCAQAREGVGKNGDWCVDFHQRFDLADAIRGCDMIKDFAPLFVEDPVRAEAFNEDLPILRQKVNVPLAAGEEWGYRWDFNKLVESSRYRLDARHPAQRRRHHRDDEDRGHLRDALRRHRPALYRPDLNRRAGPRRGHLPGPVLMEYNYGGRTIPHLPVGLDFKDGKLYPNERPGLGVELDMSKLKQIGEVTQFNSPRTQVYYRPDGSITNW